MGTPHASQARAHQVNMRLTAEGLTKIDQLRGGWSRSEYVRRAIALAAKEGLEGPKDEQW